MDPVSDDSSVPILERFKDNLLFDPDPDFVGIHRVGYDFTNVDSSATLPSESSFVFSLPGVSFEFFFRNDVGLDEVGSSSDFSSLHVNALPFRAYESIYNAFYRDDRNNPYILNGEKVYNTYLPTVDGGIDTNTYSLHSRNWEQDFLTTAVDSPQQGIAPLVGISSTGVASFALDDGSIEKVQLTVGDDGDTVVGAEYSNNLSPAVARQLVNVATSGISISDHLATSTRIFISSQR